MLPGRPYGRGPVRGDRYGRPFSHWRAAARPIIHRVLKETEGGSEQAIKKALFDAYPFGMRKYTPYKIWLQEIRWARGLTAPTWQQMKSKNLVLLDADGRQLEMFG